MDILLKISANLIGSLLSGLIAIFIFYQGKKSSLKKEKIIKEKKLTSTFQHFIHLMQNTIEINDSNIKGYSNFIENLKKDPTGEYYFNRKASRNLGRIQSINSQDILEALQLFEQKEAINANNSFLILYNAIDFLVAEKEMAAKSLHEIMTCIHGYRKQIKIELETLIEFTNKIVFTKGNILTKPLNELKNYYEEYGLPYFKGEGIGDTLSLEYHFQNLIIPMRDALVNNKVESVPEIVYFLQQVKSLTTNRDAIKYNAFELVKIFGQIKDDLETTNNKLLKEIEQLSKLIG